MYKKILFYLQFVKTVIYAIMVDDVRLYASIGLCI